MCAITPVSSTTIAAMATISTVSAFTTIACVEVLMTK
jgi:hypothetical protein